jgi:AcrR family transcriptional regulator
VSQLDLDVKTGRPRNPETERVVVDAVLNLIGDGATLTSLSLVTIARHAGVSRNSLYRRWDSKDDLYVDVVKSIDHSLPDFAEHSAHENLVKLLAVTLERIADPRVRRMDRSIVAEAQRFPELRELFVDAVIAPLYGAMKSTIRRGKETGEIRVDVDESLFAELLVSVVFTRMTSFDASDLDADSLSRRVVDLLFSGVSPN